MTGPETLNDFSNDPQQEPIEAQRLTLNYPMQVGIHRGHRRQEQLTNLKKGQ